MATSRSKNDKSRFHGQKMTNHALTVKKWQITFSRSKMANDVFAVKKMTNDRSAAPCWGPLIIVRNNLVDCFCRSSFEIISGKYWDIFSIQ